MLATSGGVLGASVWGTPDSHCDDQQDPDPLKVLVTGAHPDDPESGCGGTIRSFVEMGHDVAVLYLTRGEAGIDGVPHDEAAEIRTAEALEACELLQARPLFFGQIDGDTYVNREAYDEMARVFETESPDVVFTHWPIDTHPDHRVNSNLVYATWNAFRGNDETAFDLYYYEVMTGVQSQNFHPTHFIDITRVAAVKKEATLKHVSQKADAWFTMHEKMDEFRGFQYRWNCRFAEAFVHQGFSGVL
jgi:LmbE family N-acetylglucosaminyl deacetylase